MSLDCGRKAQEEQANPIQRCTSWSSNQGLPYCEVKVQTASISLTPIHTVKPSPSPTYLNRILSIKNNHKNQDDIASVKNAIIKITCQTDAGLLPQLIPFWNTHRGLVSQELIAKENHIMALLTDDLITYLQNPDLTPPILMNMQVIM